jgi:predicted nucleic acid-binding protein
MAFVLDASVAGTWLFKDERTAFTQVMFDRAAREQAIVPTLWWFEVRNLAVMTERRRRVTPTQTEIFLLGIEELWIVPDDLAVSDDLMRLAREHRLTAYDSAYLELARRLDLELATLDQRLVDAARSEDVKVAGDS